MIWRRLVCELHGPLRYRRDGDRWLCAGFDGERCQVIPEGITEDAAQWLRAKTATYPGVMVEEEDDHGCYASVTTWLPHLPSSERTTP